jgi:hypothetical protein
MKRGDGLISEKFAKELSRQNFLIWVLVIFSVFSTNPGFVEALKALAAIVNPVR